MTILEIHNGDRCIRFTREGNLEITGSAPLTPNQAERLGYELQEWAKRKRIEVKSAAAKKASRARSKLLRSH